MKMIAFQGRVNCYGYLRPPLMDSSDADNSLKNQTIIHKDHHHKRREIMRYDLNEKKVIRRWWQNIISLHQEL